MDDLRELLELLNAHRVEFLIIGAHAVAYYGYPRATKDLDIWARRNLENARRLADALREFGATIGDHGALEFAGDGKKMIRVGVPPHQIDVLNFGGTEDFEEVWQGRVDGALLGVSVHFPSKSALISMKKAAGRPQDLVDISKLSETS